MMGWLQVDQVAYSDCCQRWSCDHHSLEVLDFWDTQFRFLQVFSYLAFIF